MSEAFYEGIKLDLRNFDERYGKSFHETKKTFIKPQFSSGNIHPRKVFETFYMFYDELFLEPPIMKFGTGIKLDVFYTTATKKFVTSLLLRNYDVIICFSTDA